MSDERDIERVLRASGARPAPSDQLKQQVRAAVHAEWRSTVDRRARRRRSLWMSAAATVLMATAIWLSRPLFEGPEIVVANVSRAIGTVSLREHLWSRWNPAGGQQALHRGMRLMTGPDGRVALELPSGLSLRLDNNTSVSFLDADEVEMHSGAVYVDARNAPRNSLSLRTSAGVVRHLGTQYEVRLLGPSMRVRVRDGHVELQSRAGSALSVAEGEQLIVSADGEVERSTVSTTDAGWDWAAAVSPGFRIEGRTVREFLEWAARESGRELVFSSAASEAEASQSVLTGSVDAFAPKEALAAVLPTTRLRATEQDAELIVMLEGETL